MPPLVRLLSPVLIAALAGCAMGPNPQLARAPAYAAPAPQDFSTPTGSLPPSPAIATASASASTDIAGFIDPAAVRLLSARSQSEARNAQFNALQFGRPAAPRRWTGEGGATGEVTVGPFVRVNNIDCRDFTHTVTVGGTGYPRRGTACREADGTWTVADGTS
jgi:surface antigen